MNIVENAIDIVLVQQIGSLLWMVITVANA